MFQFSHFFFLILSSCETLQQNDVVLLDLQSAETKLRIFTEFSMDDAEAHFCLARILFDRFLWDHDNHRRIGILDRLFNEYSLIIHRDFDYFSQCFQGDNLHVNFL